MTTQILPLESITLDPRCQPRAELSDDVVRDYADAMRHGATFPPVTVYWDDTGTWLADGFHRVAAARPAGLADIACDVRPGGLREAMLHAVGANATHGLRRSNADKRRAVEALLADDEWAKWSDREIARRCGVSQPFVGSVRRELTDNGYQMERTVKRGKTEYTMQTGNIGRQFAFKVMPDMRPEEFERLKQSIARFGILNPVYVDQDNMVIDGNHRVKAWEELRSEGRDVLGYPVIVKRFDSDEQRIQTARALNMHKPLTEEELASADEEIDSLAGDGLLDLARAISLRYALGPDTKLVWACVNCGTTHLVGPTEMALGESHYSRCPDCRPQPESEAA